MKQITSISFVRHGQVHNPQDLFYGRSRGFPLSDDGRQQALAAKDYFANQTLAAVFSSPLLRARQTAEIILIPHEGLKRIIDRSLNETKSPYDGKPISVVEALDWDIYTGASHEFEQPMDVLTRALKFVSNVLQEYPGKHIVAVTHRDLIVFLFLWSRSQPITPSEKLKMDKHFIAPGSASTFTFSTDPNDDKPKFSYVNP